MADIAVSVPHGGGTIRDTNHLRNSSSSHGYTYCWLGGTATTGPDNNLYISVRLQRDPDFAIIDLYTYNLRDTSTHGKVSLRSRIYGLGGEAFNNNTDDFERRRINIERLNSTTALLKIPYSTSQSTYYVLEVDESTYDCTVYHFEETNGGLYNYTSASHGDAYIQCHMYMQQVEENIVVTNEQHANSKMTLCTRQWDPSAKTLTRIRVASSSMSFCDIENFQSARYIPNYGNGHPDGNNIYPYWGQSNGTSPTYITGVEGRDGKWHFRCTTNGSGSFSSINNPAAWCLTYIPTSMGGDMASGSGSYSQSWGMTGGFTGGTNGSNTDGTAKLGVFLPIDVEDSTVNNKHASFPSFYMKSWIEIGAATMIVHVDGTQNTQMYYNSAINDNSNWRSKQAVWLDSNHFFVHSSSNASSYWAHHNSYQKWFVNQYVDETYTNNEGYGDIGNGQTYNSMVNGGSQWKKIDDYTLTCNGFNNIQNIWAPE